MPSAKTDATAAPNTLEDFFTEEFNKKLPVLFVSLVFFLLTLYSFYNTGITFGSVFNFADVGQNPTQLFSLQMILFLVVFATTLALSISYGTKMKMPHVAVPLVLFTLVSLISLAVLPAYVPLFIAFALSFGAGAVFSSKKEEINFETLSSCTRNALTVFLIIVVLFSIAKIELNKNAYVDEFIVGAATLTPQLENQILPLCSQTFSGSDPKSFVLRSESDQAAGLNYDAYRESITSSSTCNASAVPVFSQLSNDEKLRLQELEYTDSVANSRKVLTRIVDKFQDPELREQIAGINVANQDLNELKTQLRSVSYFQIVETYFSLLMAFVIFSLVSLFNFGVKLISYPLNYAFLKLSKLEIEAKENS